MGEIDERLQHLPVAFDTVRIRVLAEGLLSHGEILAAEEQRGRYAVDKLGIEVLLGFDKAGIKIERHPGIFFIDVAANRVGVIHRKKAILFIEARAFRPAVGKKQLDLAPVAVRARNSMRPSDDSWACFSRDY